MHYQDFIGQPFWKNSTSAENKHLSPSDSLCWDYFYYQHYSHFYFQYLFSLFLLSRQASDVCVCYVCSCGFFFQNSVCSTSVTIIFAGLN